MRPTPRKWEEYEDRFLRDYGPLGFGVVYLADRLKRTDQSVYKRASKIGVRLVREFTGTPPAHYLLAGNTIIREDLGGAVGVRWTSATRTGVRFSTTICEKLLDLGAIERAPDTQASYRLVRRAI